MKARSPYGIVNHPVLGVPKNGANVTQPHQPLPRELWPAWARAVSTFGTSADVGVGDTIKRCLGTAGKLFEATLRTIGAPCQCATRQAEFNARFPYPGQNPVQQASLEG